MEKEELDHATIFKGVMQEFNMHEVPSWMPQWREWFSGAYKFIFRVSYLLYNWNVREPSKVSSSIQASELHMCMLTSDHMS